MKNVCPGFNDSMSASASLKRQMSRMRLVPQRVQDQHIQALESGRLASGTWLTSVQ